nr:hypothetical protein [Helicobacter pylori]
MNYSVSNLNRTNPTTNKLKTQEPLKSGRLLTEITIKSVLNNKQNSKVE